MISLAFCPNPNNLIITNKLLEFGQNAREIIPYGFTCRYLIAHTNSLQITTNLIGKLVVRILSNRIINNCNRLFGIYLSCIFFPVALNYLICIVPLEEFHVVSFK